VQARTEYNDTGSDDIAHAYTSARRGTGKANERSPLAHTSGQYEATVASSKCHK